MQPTSKRDLLKHLATGRLSLEKFKQMTVGGCFLAYEQENSEYLVKWQHKPDETMTAAQLAALDNFGDGVIGGFIFEKPEKT